MRPSKQRVHCDVVVHSLATPASFAGRTEVRVPLWCGNAHTILSSLGTSGEINWSVQLTNGTTLHETTQWKLIQ